MSFQHFRLGELSLHQPLPPHLAGAQPSSTSSFPASSSGPSPSHKQPSAPKQPYGSGDTDDGYTLIFPNIEAFHEWRLAEEERQTVEFGDTHGSKAVPPRFKDHTKLVCARHSRSGRKKYVKKHPERVRKVPSRKLEGQGCPASISYKTYFDTEEVRACYVSQHSHEIGPANLPFTRRGRKAAAQREKEKLQNNQSSADQSTPAPSTNVNPNAVTGPSSGPSAPPMFSSAVSMLAPLPGQPQYQQHPQPPPPFAYGSAPPPFAAPPMHPSVSHERWENMATLFHSIREHARGFEYPTPSVAALETVLIRLYLESPVGVSAQPSMAAIMQGGGQGGPPPSAPQGQPLQTAAHANGSNGGGNASDGVNEDSS